jgi:hypothetical protein
LVSALERPSLRGVIEVGTGTPKSQFGLALLTTALLGIGALQVLPAYSAILRQVPGVARAPGGRSRDRATTFDDFPTDIRVLAGVAAVAG